jgi:hypothetical protein
MGTSSESALSINSSRLAAAVLTMPRALALVIVVLAGTHLLLGEHSPAAHKGHEQTDFSAELDYYPIQRPVNLSRAALSALSKDELVASCLENNNLRLEELPANWFIASEIHLAGSNERDLVVTANEYGPEPAAGELPPYGCLTGASTTHFWVLRKTSGGFSLVLSQMALGLTVLHGRTNGLRDIQVGANIGASYYSTIDYRFDGHSYEIAARSFGLAGAEVPSDLSGYETAKPFVQRRGQPAEPIRAKARAWLWQRWKAHKLAYLKVRMIQHDGSVETCRYFINKSDKDEWQVIVTSHRVEHSVKSRPGVIDDDLTIATQVQRIDPATDDSGSPDVLADTEELPVSKYRLQFLDLLERAMCTL